MKPNAAYLNSFKLVLLAGLLLSLVKPSAVNAQFVNIPDPAFRNYIATLDPTAISGNNMDTTNITVTTVTTISVQGMGITDLTGIEYFDNLQSLTCHSNNITAFSSIIPNGTHEFPASMTYFNCGLNPNLQGLPLMPANIATINANYCTALNAVYPFSNGGQSLTSLLLHATSVSSLPSLNQSILNFLDVDSCLALTCLPQLPDSLVTLHALSSGVSCLPNIPASAGFTSNIGTTVCNGVIPGMLTNPSCFGYCDGEVTVVSNAVNSIYTWSNGYADTNSSGISSQQNLCAGSYMVSVTPLGGGCISYSDNVLSEPSQQQLGQPVIDPAFCFGDSTWVYYTGNPPYTFYWSTGATTDSVYLPAGNYSVYIVPGGCPVAPANFTVTTPPPLQCMNAGANTICNGSDLCVAVFGGTSPYTYLWSNLTNLPCLINPASGSYSLTVTDMNGCSAQFSFTVIVAPPINIQFTPPVYCQGMPPVNLQPVVTGGNAPFVFNWSNGTTLNNIPVSAPGTYTITVTDANGCTASASVSTTTTGGPLIAGTTTQTLPTCVTCDGVVTIDAGPFPGAFTSAFFPSTGITNLSGVTYSGFCADTLYTVLIDDGSNGTSCKTFALPDSCQMVWPGDANYDGVADNVDLLSIGVAYGASGPLRNNANNSWTGQPALGWTGALLSGTNYKHVDTNGDGIINGSDTIPVILNYNAVHPLKPFPLPTNFTDPYLYFDLIIDTVGTSQTLQIPLNLGTSTLPVDSLYGIAFTITYDTALVKADSSFIDLSNSWVGGNANNLLYISHNDPINGKLYAAVTRINHSDTSGYGTLGLFTIVTTDNVSGKLLSPLYDTLRFGLSDVMAINYQEQVRPIQAVNDSLVVEDLTGTSELEELARHIIIYPSPANNYLMVSLPGNFNYSQLLIHNLMGKEMVSMHKNKNPLFKLNLDGFNNGIYSLTFTGKSGSVVKRFTVIK